MSGQLIETDYLVVGAGAAGMAFVDTLLTETDARVVMVDRHHRAGGHWNDAYSFVRLHQPSASYGVASRELSAGKVDEVGFNRGFSELSSGPEVLDYFDKVMTQRFLPSGRVTYFPMSNYEPSPSGEHVFTSLLTGDKFTVKVRKKIVDATLMRTEVPSTHPPKYSVAPGVKCIPPNELQNIDRPYSNYIVAGSGKTGIDVCLWLLQNGIPPSRICWVMPRDAWLMNRRNFQPVFDKIIASTIAQLEAIVEAKSVDDLFARLEAAEILMRLDKSVKPTIYRCAIVSKTELEELQRIKNIVRLGRITSVTKTDMVLEQGTVAIGPNSVVIDCSANAIPPQPSLPVFEKGKVNILIVRSCQPVFSAAMIAYVESHIAEAEKNAYCVTMSNPALPIDWLSMWGVTLRNRMKWAEHKGLDEWISRCRLDFFSSVVGALDKTERERSEDLKRFRSLIKPVMEKVPKLLDQGRA